MLNKLKQYVSLDKSSHYSQSFDRTALRWSKDCDDVSIK